MPGENRSHVSPAPWLLWKNSSPFRISIETVYYVGAGVIDSNYRGEIGVTLFNFGEEDFVVNMGDRIAQLIFEKIKTPKIKELDSF